MLNYSASIEDFFRLDLSACELPKDSFQTTMMVMSHELCDTPANLLSLNDFPGAQYVVLLEHQENILLEPKLGGPGCEATQIEPQHSL